MTDPFRKVTNLSLSGHYKVIPEWENENVEREGILQTHLPFDNRKRTFTIFYLLSYPGSEVHPPRSQPLLTLEKTKQRLYDRILLILSFLI